MDNKELIMRIAHYTKQLREAYYRTIDARAEYPEVPNGGEIKDSTTNTPAIYLEGPHCCKSGVGCCVNCFYSMYSQHDIHDTKDKLKKQVDYILDHFDEMVIDKQYKMKEDAPIEVTVSPTGSYFSEYEFPKEVRLDMLKNLVEKSKQYGKEINLIIEAHASDIEINGIDPREANLLNQLHTKCILGFEAVNEYSRNVLYNKRLPIHTYENAVRILQNNTIQVGSFVMGGLITYTDLETKQDMLETISYLQSQNVFPVLMFSNIQSYTIPDILHQNGKYELLQPFTTTDIAYEMFNIIGEKSYWMIPEPVSGPPTPKNNIFYDRKDTTTSPELNKELHKLLFVLRMTRNVGNFMRSYEKLKEEHKKEYAEYKRAMEEKQLNITPLESRMEKALDCISEHMKNYIDNIVIEESGNEEIVDNTIKTETMKELDEGGR